MPARLATRLLLCLALVGCTNAPGDDYDPDWDSQDVFQSGGKADGLLDEAPALELGGNAAGRIDGDNLDLYRIELGRTDEVRVTVHVTDGDLNPHVSLYRGTSTYVHSAAWNLDGQTLTKDYVAEDAGTYILLVRAFRGQGEGSYDISVACTGGLCAGDVPPPPTDEISAGDVSTCLESARQCAFEALPSFGGRVGEVRSRTIWENCVATVDGGRCGAACGWTNPDDMTDTSAELCNQIRSSLTFYADQSAACLGLVNDCMDSCTDQDQDWSDGELGTTPIAMCWSNGFNGTCDGFARDHSACGGEILADSAGECTALCHSTTGAWLDDLDTLCSDDADCHDACGVDIAAASGACGGTLTAESEGCVSGWLDNHSAYVCIDQVEDRNTFRKLATCNYMLSQPFTGTSADLETSITSSRTIDARNRAYSTLWRQIIHAGVHLFDYQRSQPYADALSEVLNEVDDHEITAIELTVGGAQYDWIKLHLGDTEVGVIYTHGTLSMVAEIGDGDFKGCTPL